MEGVQQTNAQAKSYQRQKSTKERRTCHFCHKQGHLRKDFFKCKGQDDSRQQNPALAVGTEDEGIFGYLFSNNQEMGRTKDPLRFHIAEHLNGHVTNALVDTGSNCTSIFESLANQLGLPMERSKPTSIRYDNGSTQYSKNVANMEWQLNGSNFVTKLKWFRNNLRTFY